MALVSIKCFAYTDRTHVDPGFHLPLAISKVRKERNDPSDLVVFHLLHCVPQVLPHQNYNFVKD